MAAKRQTRKPAESQIERRVFGLSNLELRFDGEGESAPVLTGYAAVFNELSVDLGGFREQIAPGCFEKSIAAGADIRCLFNHEASKILGRTKAGTLDVEERDAGVYFECPLPNTTYANDLRESMERGDVDQCSFGFVTRKDSWAEERDAESGLPVRTLLEADLFDVSPVTFPAYPQTTAEVRALVEQMAEVQPPADERDLSTSDFGEDAEQDANAGETDDAADDSTGITGDAPAEAEAETAEGDGEAVADAEAEVEGEVEPVEGAEAETAVEPEGEEREQRDVSHVQTAMDHVNAAAECLQAALDATEGAEYNSTFFAEGAEPHVVLSITERELPNVAEYFDNLAKREWDWGDDDMLYGLTQMLAIASWLRMSLEYDLEEQAEVPEAVTQIQTIMTTLTGLISGVVANERDGDETFDFRSERLRLLELELALPVE